MAGRAWLKLLACVMPLFLAGCVALPGSSHNTGTVDPSVVLATRVAAAVRRWFTITYCRTCRLHGGVEQ